ncbi:MAG: hypothetical protein KBT50_06165 [Cycloclasticus sp.]|nr:hypothetical protein [Cycloclasticus sp.]MBQ0790189.1 hypothetical protein [Cycloclasticus sp.]
MGKKMYELSINRYGAGMVTVVAALILITPLCGVLFNCGCTWPWAGLESHCNIYEPQVEHPCPWCASLLTGALSVGLAVLTGFLVAIKDVKSRHDIHDAVLAGWQRSRQSPGFIKRVVRGLIGFLVVAVAMGWLSAYWQDAPYFLLTEWLNFFIS